ncbi:MAG: DUF1772 domain-containing protein [Bacteroidota bacterium]
MEITLSNLSLFATVLLVGLVAGLCFTWGNAVTPGIGQLDDQSYLSAFQQMNRSILNPIFYGVFMGSLMVGIVAVFTSKGISPTHFWMVFTAVLIYFFGVILVTVFGNVPLNELLDTTNLAQSSAEELSALRQQFEEPWNRFHTIRVVTGTIAFALLIITCINK